MTTNQFQGFSSGGWESTTSLTHARVRVRHWAPSTSKCLLFNRTFSGLHLKVANSCPTILLNAIYSRGRGSAGEGLPGCTSMWAWACVLTPVRSQHTGMHLDHTSQQVEAGRSGDWEQWAAHRDLVLQGRSKREDRQTAPDLNLWLQHTPTAIVHSHMGTVS